MRSRTAHLAAALLALAWSALAPAALASSDDAWAEFQDEVESACRALAQADAEVEVEVNPYGSENYGAAIVTVTANWGTERSVCIFDKTSRKAELTSPF